MENEAKISCFAYKEDRNEITKTTYPHCTALNDLWCAKEGKCSFYRTKNQYRELMKKYPMVNYSISKE